jgi:hypothetical protein
MTRRPQSERTLSETLRTVQTNRATSHQAELNSKTDLVMGPSTKLNLEEVSRRERVMPNEAFVVGSKPRANPDWPKPSAMARAEPATGDTCSPTAWLA